MGFVLGGLAVCVWVAGFMGSWGLKGEGGRERCEGRKGVGVMFRGVRMVDL